jgi:chemotaxis protein methyltransferase CheR
MPPQRVTPGPPWPVAEPSPMSDTEFAGYQALLHRLCGIHVTPIKKAMLSGRLSRRLRELGNLSYGDYLRRIDNLQPGGGDADERQIAIDLLTTNETGFFREPRHFELLRQRLLPTLGAEPVRAWCAACASGEEPYSLAMTLADTLGLEAPWTVLATDISTRMLATGERALYPLDHRAHIPPENLRRYCLKGTGEYEGWLLIDRVLRQRVSFRQLNLAAPMPALGPFDLILLRNVIIYFDAETKRRVIESVAHQLRPGGWLIVGHTEALLDYPASLEPVVPTVYRRVGP